MITYLSKLPCWLCALDAIFVEVCEVVCWVRIDLEERVFWGVAEVEVGARRRRRKARRSGEKRQENRERRIQGSKKHKTVSREMLINPNPPEWWTSKKKGEVRRWRLQEMESSQIAVTGAALSVVLSREPCFLNSPPKRASNVF